MHTLRFDGCPPTPLKADAITVGRTIENDIQLDDESISSHHAELQLQNGHYVLKDLGSTNGIEVNGQRITETLLCNNDCIRFGSIEAVYQHAPSDSQTAPALVPPALPSPSEAQPEAAEEASKQSKSRPTRESRSATHEIMSALSGLQPLSGLRIGSLFADTINFRSQTEIEEHLSCGSPGTTPPLEKVVTEWPRPWAFSQILVIGLLTLGVFIVSMELFSNLRLFPGLIIIGAFAVPIACLTFFFEMNVLRNVSLYQVGRLLVLGGAISLFVTLLINQVGNFDGSFIGASSAGIVEEIAKLATALILVGRVKAYRWTLNGILFGAAIGAGFAGFETAGYIFENIDSSRAFYSVLIHRGIFSPFAHIVWTACTVGALWRVMDSGPFRWDLLYAKNFLRIFAIPVALHMLWNSPFAWMELSAKNWRIIEMIWAVLLAGSWYLALMLIQDGLRQVRAAQRPKSVNSHSGQSSKGAVGLSDSATPHAGSPVALIIVALIAVSAVIGNRIRWTPSIHSKPGIDTEVATDETIHNAVTNGNLVKVQAHLKEQPGLANSKTDDGYPMLQIAAGRGHTDVAKLLLSRGANANAKDPFGGTALQWAASSGHQEMVALLLLNKADINAVDRTGLTALLNALYSGHKEMAAFLIAAKSDVNATGTGFTALHYVAREGHKDIAELLLANNAEINIKDRDGETPLFKAVDHGRKEIVALLLTHNADVNAKTTSRFRNGQTPLMVAAGRGDRDVAALLLSRNADVNARGSSGGTPLHEAAYNGQMEMVKFLLSNRADVNARTTGGITPLYLATVNHHRGVAEVLRLHGGHE